MLFRSKISADEVFEKVYAKALETYRRKGETISQQAYPVLKDVYERMSHVYENVVVPVSDGVRLFQVIVNLKKSVETEGKEIARSYEKTVVLSTIDEAWKEHLREMDELKQSVQNASYEQKDPLLIYKFESFELFKTMLNRVNKDVISTLMKGFIPTESTNQVQEAQKRRNTDMSNLRASRPELAGGGGSDPSQQRQQRVEPVRVEKKVGRNDPCPCGSGKKYKQCHGAGIPDRPVAP